MSEDESLRAIYEADPSLLRPDTPDMARLLDGVVQMEALKASGVSAEQAYEDIVDVPSVSYLAVQRSAMTMDLELEPYITGLKILPRAVQIRLLHMVRELTANAWVEGFAYGVTFQREGGHRPNTE